LVIGAAKIGRGRQIGLEVPVSHRGEVLPALPAVTERAAMETSPSIELVPKQAATSLHRSGLLL
jgi:hypothetical protein